MKKRQMKKVIAMNHVYSFEIREFRAVLAECCKNIFNDNVMAEILFKRICDCCENYLDDNYVYDLFSEGT